MKILKFFKVTVLSTSELADRYNTMRDARFNCLRRRRRNDRSYNRAEDMKQGVCKVQGDMIPGQTKQPLTSR
jgi:predicted DNA-binding protein YlxM (UPF0122 family)